MPDLILHHYDLSPFSEKIRLLMGRLDLSWRSVEVSPMLPRPDLMVLTGGYRRIPVLQIGADIVCDTALIARRLAERAGDTTLHPDGSHGEAVRDLAAWADSRLFLVAFATTMSLRGARGLMANFSWRDRIRFVVDRLSMARGGRAKPVAPAAARRELDEFLTGFGERVSDGYAFGAMPTIADFSVYHPLRFIREAAGLDLIDGFPEVLAWMERVKAIGHGHPESMTSHEALEVARLATPTAPATGDASPHAVGDRVAVGPRDYGVTPVEGRLVGCDEHSWIVGREHPAVGDIYVHLPRAGYHVVAIG